MKKTEKKSNIQRFIKRICNARAWSDCDRIKTDRDDVTNDAKSYFTIDTSQNHGMNKRWISILLILFPIFALADSSMTFAPPLSDYSVGFLGNVFGMVNGVLYGTGSQIMGVIFSVFNAAVMALGGMIITYTMLVSTMNTAHEGEMLGKKWNSIWVPIRATAGFALLIPKASGYCLLQIFVMWIVVQGAGAADKLWSAALGYLNRGGVIVQGQQDPTKAILGQTGTENVTIGAMVMLSGQVCMLAVEQILKTTLKNYQASSICTEAIAVMNASPAAADLANFCLTTSIPSFTSTFDAVAAQQSLTNAQANYIMEAANQGAYSQYQKELSSYNVKYKAWASAINKGNLYPSQQNATQFYQAELAGHSAEVRDYNAQEAYRQNFAVGCQSAGSLGPNNSWHENYKYTPARNYNTYAHWPLTDHHYSPPKYYPTYNAYNKCIKFLKSNPAPGHASPPAPAPSPPPTKPTKPPYAEAGGPGTAPTSVPQIVTMPNFTASTGAAQIFQQFNGICGAISWSPFSNASLTALKQLQSQDTGQGMMTLGEMQTAMSARAVGIQQMYTDLLPAAQLIVNNDTLITNNTYLPPPSSGKKGAPPPPPPPSGVDAEDPFGYPLEASGAVCTKRSKSCNHWGMPTWIPNPGTPLLTGIELQGAIYDYTNIVKPTLTLIAQGGGDASVQKAKAFIRQANAQGWIMAGSYFFNLVSLNVMNSGGSGNEATGAGQSLQDNNSGLNKSQFTLGTLSSAFIIGSNNCNPVTPSPTPWVPTTTIPAYSVLCNILNGNSTNIVDIDTLYTGTSYPQIQTPPTAQPYTGTPYPPSTVYGYLNNAVMIELPGQHGESPLNVGKNMTITVAAPTYQLPIWNPGCFGWKCLPGDIASTIYNQVVRTIFNDLIAQLIQWINQLLFKFITIPIVGFAGIFLGAIQILEIPGINPVIALANMGTYYINFAGNMWEIIIITEALLTATMIGAILIPLTGIVLPLIFSWLGIMVSIGFVTAYYIPFVPYMIFTFGSIAWLMAVVESMVAAPIVALGVIHPEGHDTFGKAEPAIMILMNIFLRPSMMIIGYIAAISITYVGVWILNSGFNQAIEFTSNTGQYKLGGSPAAGGGQIGENIIGGTFTFFTTLFGLGSSVGSQVAIPAPQVTVSASTLSGGYTGWAGIAAYFFMILIYTTMYMTIVEKAFTLISVLPDKVLRWIGGQPESYGEGAAQWAEQAKGKIEKGGEDTAKGMGAVGKGMTAAAAGETKEAGGSAKTETDKKEPPAKPS